MDGDPNRNKRRKTEPPKPKTIKISFDLNTLRGHGNKGHKLIPIVLISALWLYPNFREKTCNFIDRNIVTMPGLQHRQNYYLQNNLPGRVGYTTTTATSSWSNHSNHHNNRIISLDLPRASMARRIGAWMIDGAICSIFLMPLLMRTLRLPYSVGITGVSLLWFGRDLWLQSFGAHAMQSPGRYCCGIRVVSLEGGHACETWNTLKLNSCVAILLACSTFLTGSIAGGMVYAQVFGRANGLTQRLFANTHYLIGLSVSFGYAYTVYQLMFAQQLWMDKIAGVHVVNVHDLPIPVSYPNKTQVQPQPQHRHMRVPYDTYYDGDYDGDDTGYDE